MMLPESSSAVPLNMILPCPSCGAFHVDAPEPGKGWMNPPHKSHLCHFCGCVWRPADVPTNGVAKTQTRGSDDTWPPTVNSTPSIPQIRATANAKRIGFGMSWRDVAAAAGCSSSTLSRWGTGRGEPSASVLLAVWRWANS